MGENIKGETAGEEVAEEMYSGFCKALNETFVAMTNPKNVNGSSNRWPLRLPYGNSGVSSNPNVRAAYGDGLYVFSEPIWIFGGSR